MRWQRHPLTPGAAPARRAPDGAHDRPDDHSRDRSHDRAAAAWVSGRAEVVALWRAQLLALAQPDAPRTLRWHDPGFAGWPLDEPAVLDSLTQWLRPRGRRLQLVVQHVPALAQAHPRFARWRRDWVHAIETWQPQDPQADAVPALWLAPGLAIERVEGEPWRARLLSEGRALQALRVLSDALLQRCEPAWPVNPTGL